MAAWPDTLPEPQRKLSTRPGSNLKRRKVQTGRTELRRFGDGAPDQVKVVFRLRGAIFTEFEYFYERDLNLGINYFTAPWLALMGYEDHMARILGYWERKGHDPFYNDYEMVLLIQKTDWCPEDTKWPTIGVPSA